MQDYDCCPEQELDREVTLETTVSVQWNNDAVIQGVINKLANRIYNDIKPKVEKAILESLDDQVNQAITAMLGTEIQPTDRWGEPTGSKVSIRAMLQQDAEAWLTQKVDQHGRVGRDSYGNTEPRVHWIFQDALNGPDSRRGKSKLQLLVEKTAKESIGDIAVVVEGEIRKQAREALGL